MIRENFRDVGTTGLEVEQADCLATATARLAEGGVDAVLLDLGLPGTDGIEAFSIVRESAVGAAIVVISRVDDQELALEAVAAGAHDYVVQGRFDGPALTRIIYCALQRKRAERAVNESDNRFRALVENSNDGIAVFEPAGTILYCSPSTQRILGYDPQALVGQYGLDFLKESDRPRIRALLSDARERPGAGRLGSASLRHADGSYRLIEATVTNMVANPAVGGIVFNYRDVTEQHKSADLVRWLSIAVDQSSTAVAMTDPDGRIEYVNEKFTEDTGYAASEVIGKTPHLFCTDGFDECYEKAWGSTLGGSQFRGEVPIRTKSGRVYWADLRISPVRDGDGDVIHYVGLHINVSERRAMDEKLRQTNARLTESAERFRLLSEVTFDGIAIVRNGKVLEANPGLLRLLQLANESEIIGRDWTDFASRDSREESEQRLAGATEGRFGVQLIRGDGALLYAEATSRRHVMNGEAVQIMAIRDLTEKRAVEEQLRQAQKMEAVGQLAGGVAHDFNNILAAILITAELTLEDRTLSAQLREDIQAIHAAGKRGADITRQLLTFSRKQMTMPRVVDLGQLLEEMQPMLGHLVMAHTSIETHPLATRGIEADPIQLEQIILNLVVNARDAMPDGGAVRIETRDVDISGPTTELPLQPGPYLVLAVADCGVGIEDSVRARIFEPFFTTKPPGKGTGLGLSTVAGIVRSLEGGIRVTSNVGRGTTFEVYLPARIKAGDMASRIPAMAAARGSETVLVVEDETIVRTSICRVLRSLGYRPIEARSGRDAILICERLRTPIDLVVTDVVMPEMTGPELLAKLREAVPGLPAVIVSGYTDSVLDGKSLSPLTAFIEKPFSSRALALKVREQLDTHSPVKESDYGDLFAAAGAVG